MIYLLMVIIALGGGLTVGGAIAAFVSMLEIIPRLVHLSRTHQYKIAYQNAFTVGVIVFTIIYFYDYNMDLGNIIVGLIGLVFGTFIGIFSSALAEVLNVIPVMAKKFKLKDDLKIIIYALLFGKVAGSLYYWIILK